MEALLNRINNELDIIRKQIVIVRSNSSDIFKINAFLKTIELSNEQSIPCDFQKEWIKEQITENHLPEQSSGSFVNALLDEDILINCFEIEEHPEAEFLTNYIMERLLNIRRKKKY